MNLKDFLTGKYFKSFALAISGLAVLLLVFSAGVFVGLEKAKFSYGWGENYFRNFVGPRGAPGGPFAGRDPFWDKNYLNPHGVFGEIIKIDQGGLVIKDFHNLEIPITAGGSLVVKNKRGDLRLSDLQVGNKVVIIGSPDKQGKINAKFIRVDNGFINNQ